MRYRRDMIPKQALILLFSLVVCGCGGSSGPQPEDPGDPGWGTDAIEILRQDGLIVSLESDKTVYQLGEEIRFWFSMRNEGSKTRTLELHPRDDETGGRTYGAAIFYYEGIGGYPGVYGLIHYDTISKEVRPGETIRLVEFVWDQIRKDNGAPASPGYYDLGILIENLYVDGRKPANCFTFDVHGFKPGVQIQE